ncbi:MAG: tetratricopeptide repeat protein [Longimicrobiales bacterium]
MSFSRELVTRRVPQFLALYLGVAWGVVQFINFLEDRYALSPHLTDFALLGLALLIPSVVLFTYNHGKPGRDEWTRSDKLGLSVNIIIAVAVLLLVFRNKDLGAVVSSVTTKNETGQTVKRAVAKASFRKRLALFNFDGAADDTAIAWLRYGLPLGLAVDLSQDGFIELRQSVQFRGKLRQLGYGNELNVPLSLKRTIANEQHLPYFSHATISRKDDQISVEFALYNSESGELVQRRIYTDTGILELVDRLTVGLKRDLGVPETSKVPDLPVAEVLTSSLPAFRAFAEGAAALQLNNQWPQATAHLEKAVALDPTFANAWYTLHNVYLLSNQRQDAMPPLQKAIDHIYRFPERMQYVVKFEYYMVKQDKERAEAVARMNVDVFPQDISSYELLLQLQSMRYDRDGMIASVHKILELDSSRAEMLRQLGGLYEVKGDFDDALRYYTQYAQRFPNQSEAFLSIGELQKVLGNVQEARANFEKAGVLATGRVAPTLALARLETEQGNFDAALRLYEEALSSARSAEDRAPAFDGLADYYDFRGQVRRSLEYVEQFVKEQARFNPPLNTALNQLSALGTYVRAGKAELARQTLQRVSTQLTPPFHQLAAMGEMQLLIELERPDEAEPAIVRMEQAIQALGLQVLQPRVVLARGRQAEQRGQYAQANTYYEERRKLNPGEVSIYVAMGRCERKLGQSARSIELLQKTLRVLPFHARANYEIGLSYLEAGQRDKALEHLRRAMTTWSAADPGYRLPAEAKAKLKELEGTR